MSLRLRSFVVLASACGVVVLAAPAAFGAGGGLERGDVAAAEPTANAGGASAAARHAMRQGYLVPDQAAYDRAKAEAARQAAPVSGEETVAGALAPAVAREWDGVFDTTVAPSDSTGAVGDTRYIELVNRVFGIYRKTANAPIATGTLNTLVGAGVGPSVFDPQVIWDPQTNRFYYTADQINSASDHVLAFGFSKTATPNSAADFCQYTFNYGAEFPDYPKLGDTRDFLLIGSNVFNTSNVFLRSDLAWITKPAPGSTCPAPASFLTGVETNLTGPGATTEFTPVPANQTDTSPTGYVVGRSRTLPANRLVIHRVTRNPDDTANVQNPGQTVTVPSYTVPANAPQKGSTRTLDTLDSRPTQAVSGIDPGAGLAIWTQHTIDGPGGRSIVRWYEIDPITRTRFQTGTVQSGTLFNFNGAISPNRSVDGATTAGGDDMVLGFTASGTTGGGLTGFPQVRMVSKVGAAAQSAQAVVHSSPGAYIGFDCTGSDLDCRWGDYSGATPDPRADQVWLVNQYASGGTSTAQTNWLTRNWIATP